MAVITAASCVSLFAADSEARLWDTRASFDYYHYNLTLDVPQTAGDATVRGDVFGGSAGVKFPWMKPDDWLDVSYRHGHLNGTMVNTVYNVSGSAPTDVDQASLIYRWRVLTAPSPALEPLDLDVLLGFNWLRNNQTWTAPVPEIAVYTSHYKEDIFTGNVGLSAGWRLLSQASENGRRRFQLGLRAEGIGGAGAQLVDRDDNFSSVSQTRSTFSFDAKGMLRAEYQVGAVGYFLEGGYQYLRFFHTTSDEVFHGPLARVGASYAF